MSKARVIEIARGELGYTESPPGSNRTKYWDEYDKAWQGQPWCVAFLWWCFKHAGESAAFFGGAKTGSCGTLLRWYKAQGLSVPADQAQPGDIVILNFRGTKDTQHCGLVVEAQSGGMLGTIEGNTSQSGSQSNGGEVCLKTRYLSQVVGVCRPEFKEEPVKHTDYEKHWAREDIEWVMDKGLLKGYPDGAFRPDQPVTRAELAVILRRLEEKK